MFWYKNMKVNQFHSLDRVKSILMKNTEMLNALESLDVIMELEKITKEIEIQYLENSMFIFNNALNSVKKSCDINIQSYNIGVCDVMSKMIYLLCNNEKKNQHINVINNLSTLQKKILREIYYNDGIDSKTLRENLHISSQQLYNVTHDINFLKIVNVYDDYKGKFKHYSLTLKCRNYLDMELKPPKNTMDYEFKRWWYDDEIELLSTRKNMKFISKNRKKEIIFSNIELKKFNNKNKNLILGDFQNIVLSKEKKYEIQKDNEKNSRSQQISYW